MSKLTILLLLPLLCGCAQLGPLYCTMGASDSMTAVLGPDGPIGCLERHDGQVCIWPETGAQGQVGECIIINDWAEDWVPARKQLGLPTEPCVYCQDGSKLCPPQVEWETLKALYR